VLALPDGDKKLDDIYSLFDIKPASDR